MGTFLEITFDIVQILLNVVWWIIVVQAILSWLIAFNVINTYNDFVRALWRRARHADRADLSADPPRSCPISARSIWRRSWC